MFLVSNRGARTATEFKLMSLAPRSRRYRMRHRLHHAVMENAFLIDHWSCSSVAVSFSRDPRGSSGIFRVPKLTVLR